MAEKFYTILTNLGKNKLANSGVSGDKVNLKTFQMGDGNGSYYEPSEGQTALINKVWEGEISSISTDELNPNWIVIQAIIPATDGGFYIREVGIFDEDGDLIAVSKVSETYKPVIEEGSMKDLSFKVVLEVSNVDSITLKIDPNVAVATKNDIEMLKSEIQDTNTKISDMKENKANQSDLDIINAKLVTKADNSDNSRTTTSKDVTGAINELNTNKANKDGTVQTNLNADMIDGYHASNLALSTRLKASDFQNTLLKAGIYTNTGDGILNADGTVFRSGWWHVYVNKHFDENGFGAQIILPLNNTAEFMYYRTSSGTSWAPWKQLISQDGGNLSGILHALSNTSYTTMQVRNICLSPNDANVSLMGPGDIWIKYS